MNILFLTAATGGGHVKAAQALIQYMGGRHSCCETRLVDSVSYVNPLIQRLVFGTYLYTVKNVPGIYGKLYDLSEKDEAITDLMKNFNYLLSGRLSRLLAQYSPDAVVCTHTMPLQMLSFLKRKGRFNIPVIGIVTDYTHHYFWKLEGVDAFIVAHEYIKEDMIGMGIPPEKVHACGIPVSQNFQSVKDRRLILNKLGLDNKPTILLMGGSLGLGELQQMLESILRLRRDIQAIAVAGLNEKLRNQLESLARGSSKKVRVLGYTNKISELMDASCLLVSKPGGVTVSEALVKKLPLLVMSPIPGQEERNARFLIDSGAAVRPAPSEDAESMLEYLLDRPALLNKMSEAAGNLSKPMACRDIALLVEDLILRPGRIEHMAAHAPIVLKG